MADNTIAVLTYKSVETILRIGGTQSWVLQRARAKACKYAVLYRNAYHEDVEGSEEHGSVFMVGRIKDVVPSTDTEGRWLITFSEYALCDWDDEWEGRNPVKYWSSDDYEDVSFDDLEFLPMPPAADETVSTHRAGLTLAQAKSELAAFHNVPESAIEINIRW